MEHLGRLPSQLNLTDAQAKELLTYHRIKRKSQYVCRECSEKSQQEERTCFICSRQYTEKHGPTGRAKSGDGDFDKWVKEQKQKQLLNASPEAWSDFQQKWLESFKKHGGKIIGEDV